MGDSSSSSASAMYIHMVHRLIEECILFNMSREECMDALSKHAGIQPLVTSTVWKELEKGNRGFFDAYTKKRGEAAAVATSCVGQRDGDTGGGSARFSPTPPKSNPDYPPFPGVV